MTVRKIKGFFKGILILPALIIGILLPINSVMAEDLNLAEESTSQSVGYSQLQGDTAKYTNPDTNYQVFIDDNYNLLTDQEEAELLETMKPLTAYGGVAFVSKYVEGSTAENYAKEVAYKYFTGASGTVFLIDMGNRKVYMYNTGKNSKTITSGKSLSISDNVYSYAKSGDYFKCANEAFVQAGTLLKGGKIAEPMKYISNALIAIIVSLLIMYFIVKSARGTVAKRNAAMLGAVKTRFNVDNLEVNFVRSQKNVDASSVAPMIIGGIGGFHIGSHMGDNNDDNDFGGFGGGDSGGFGGFDGGDSGSSGGGHDF